MTRRLGQPIVIENKPGAGGNLGIEAVVNSAPDGYTLLFIGGSNVVNASLLYKNVRFDFARDIAPVAAIGRVPLVLEVNPAVPAKTVSEFIAYAKANPGKLMHATTGIGTLYLAAELFKSTAGIEMVHVPYRGSAPALTDLMGGQVQVMFDGVASSLEHIKAGKLRPLAVTAASKFEGLPDVPTLSETIPGFEASSFFGVGVPRATPPGIIMLLNQAINEALNDPHVRKRLNDLALITTPGTPSEFAKALAADAEKWAKVIDSSGIKPE
jgi:tripartite-type tricarboxylate transporter receptor subunit TctC